jgi:hypothetical protein
MRLSLAKAAHVVLDWSHVQEIRVGMTKGRVVTFIRNRQIGWTEKKQQVPRLRFHGAPHGKAGQAAHKVN